MQQMEMGVKRCLYPPVVLDNISPPAPTHFSFFLPPSALTGLPVFKPVSTYMETCQGIQKVCVLKCTRSPWPLSCQQFPLCLWWESWAEFQQWMRRSTEAKMFVKWVTVWIVISLGNQDAWAEKGRGCFKTGKWEIGALNLSVVC